MGRAGGVAGGGGGGGSVSEPQSEPLAWLPGHPPRKALTSTRRLSSGEEVVVEEGREAFNGEKIPSERPQNTIMQWPTRIHPRDHASVKSPPSFVPKSSPIASTPHQHRGSGSSSPKRPGLRGRQPSRRRRRGRRQRVGAPVGAPGLAPWAPPTQSADQHEDAGLGVRK